MKESNLIALIYTDQGPKGICAQSCTITNNWLQIHLFDDEDKARAFCKKTGLPNGRKKPQWDIVSETEGDGYDNLTDHRNEDS